MKKKQRCLIKRFSALVAALMLSAALCVPCFASNNAATQKWYVAAESNFPTESGSIGKYFKLTPYVNGEEFTYTSLSYRSTSQLRYYDANGNVNTANYTWVMPINYPDWWRSSLPLGNLTYLDFRLVSTSYSSDISYGYTDYNSNVYVYLFDSANAFSSAYNIDYAGSSSDKFAVSDVTLSGAPSFYLVSAPKNTSGSFANAGSFYMKPSSNFTRGSISDIVNLVPALGLNSSPATSYPLFGETNLSNLSSDRFVIAVAGIMDNTYWKSTFKLSFWVDANKLPAGLEVGDEFPANNDAFDNLREELLKQFPEASENIENGKTTIQGWNDTETVDTDVASTSISALNALFQNLGGFLFIVSLMVFGAVVLRMLIRKAVDG